ncbi:MAG: 3-phosphoshikimate 1-carboxyvinyltransferase [Lachnospiraceae bacterium]
MIFEKADSLKGELLIPGDKSISHRAVMLGTLAEGMTEIRHFLNGADCLSTIQCFRHLGITIEEKNAETILVYGKGLSGLTAPQTVLDVGNSGTTARLLSGILAAQPFSSELSGDDSINRRPMKRIMAPLSMMGASIRSKAGNDCAPLLIEGRPLKGIHYESPVASAQVKSALLFAGLYADGETSVHEPYLSRNHSEQMIRYFGGTVHTEGTTATVLPGPRLKGRLVDVPGDISSAAYFITAGLIVPNSEILIKNVGINPTRSGILEAVRQMGGRITLCGKQESTEPRADIIVKSSTLHGITIEGELIPTLIDEIPILAVLACFATGKTIIKDAQELKVKESNRIDVMVENLTKMGASITATEDGMIIEGGRPLHGAIIGSRLDHRVAMSFAVAGLSAEGKTEIIGSECVNISYPGFYQDLFSLIK